MGKYFLSFVGLVLVFIGGIYYFRHSRDSNFSLSQLFSMPGSIGIMSQDFTEGNKIPSRFTCDGENISPSFFISNVPSNTKSLVLIMEDMNSIPEPFTHWISFNLSPETVSIDRSKVLANADTGVNDFGESEYNGPCPPAGSSHKYYFRVYALDTVLSLERPWRSELDRSIRSHIIATGQLGGVYSKNP